MPTVTRIDDVNVVAAGTAQMLGDQVGRTARGMTDDEKVGVHRAQVVDGIEQGLALGRRGLVDVEIDDISGEALGGNLERGSGTRRVLEKQVEDALAAQQRHLLDLPCRDFHERGSGIENLGQDRLGQPFDRKQMGQFAVGIELRVMHVPASTPLDRQHPVREPGSRQARAPHSRHKKWVPPAIRGRLGRPAQRARRRRGGRSRIAR